MMDDFEKNIRKNRQEFGGERPNREKMWANIEKRLPAPESKIIPLWKRTGFRIAAGFLIVLGFAALLFTANSNADQAGLAIQESNEMLEINMHYKKLVDLQLRKLEANQTLTASDKKEFIQYISDLEKENDSLKKELEDNLDNQEVLKAIISNYKKQIDLIEKLLERLDQPKTNKDETGISI